MIQFIMNSLWISRRDEIEIVAFWMKLEVGLSRVVD